MALNIQQSKKSINIILIFVALIIRRECEVHIAEKVLELVRAAFVTICQARETMSRLADYKLLKWLINTPLLRLHSFLQTITLSGEVMWMTKVTLMHFAHVCSAAPLNPIVSHQKVVGRIVEETDVPRCHFLTSFNSVPTSAGTKHEDKKSVRSLNGYINYKYTHTHYLGIAVMVSYIYL